MKTLALLAILMVLATPARAEDDPDFIYDVKGGKTVSDENTVKVVGKMIGYRSSTQQMIIAFEEGVPQGLTVGRELRGTIYASGRTLVMKVEKVRESEVVVKLTTKARDATNGGKITLKIPTDPQAAKVKEEPEEKPEPKKVPKSEPKPDPKAKAEPKKAPKKEPKRESKPAAKKADPGEGEDEAEVGVIERLFGD